MGTYKELFLVQHKLEKIIEEFFSERKIFKAYLPTISTTVTNEPYTEFFEVISPFGELYYLQPSPEFYLKKLIAIEKESFYYLGPVYRAGEPENTNIHLPEFFMLEWYKIGCSLEQFMKLTQDMLNTIFRDLNIEVLRFNNKLLSNKINIISWKELFDLINIDLDEMQKLYEVGEYDNIKKIRSYLSSEDDFESSFYKIFYNELYEKYITNGEIWFLYDFPRELKALSKVVEGYAKRFEVYWNGIELINGYEEETNIEKLEDIFKKNKEIRLLNKQRIVEIDKDLIVSTSKLGLISGASLGIDRLLYIFLKDKMNLGSIKDLKFKL